MTNPARAICPSCGQEVGIQTPAWRLETEKKLIGGYINPAYDGHTLPHMLPKYPGRWPRSCPGGRPKEVR